MKQLLPLFLFLLPCLALAQYPSNGNQKITLGEQTTADGLIFRGRVTDTTLTVKSDTAAYFVLDTVNINLYTYKASATGRKWIQLGSDTTSLNLVSRFAAKLNISDTASMLTPYWRAGRFSGVLPVANGGTGASSFSPNNYLIRTNSSGIFDTSAVYEAGGNVGIGTTTNAGFKLDVNGTGRFSSSVTANGLYAINSARFYRSADDTYWTINNDSNNYLNFSTFLPDNTAYGTNPKMILLDNGKLGIGVSSPTQVLHVVGNARITAMNGIGDIGADANGVLQAATSDMNLKNTIENSPFGLNEILLLNPVTFLYNDTDRKLDSDVKEVGFIAQDVFDVIPNAVSSTGMGDLQLDYRAITATLVKAIQEQNALIKSLEQRIINLENK
jgi:hypothetical protein